jgi:glutamine synthetase adenylyltransferase
MTMAKKSDGALAAPKSENDYEADSALETLTRAEEIKQDKKLMKRVASKAGRKVKAITGLSDVIAKHAEKKPRSLTELREIRNSMGRSDDMGE